MAPFLSRPPDPGTGEAALPPPSHRSPDISYNASDCQDVRLEYIVT